MTFDEKYNELPVGSRIEFEGDEHVKVARLGFCWNCGRNTYWTSSSFAMAYICSERCSTEKWNEYWEATRG